MVTAIRDAEKALGDGVKRPVVEEEEVKIAGRRSIVARVDIPEGVIITQEMLDIRRPGTGIEPGNLGKVVGKRAKSNIRSGELITLAEIE